MAMQRHGCKGDGGLERLLPAMRQGVGPAEKGLADSVPPVGGGAQPRGAAGVCPGVTSVEQRRHVETAGGSALPAMRQGVGPAERRLAEWIPPARRGGQLHAAAVVGPGARWSSLDGPASDSRKAGWG